MLETEFVNFKHEPVIDKKGYPLIKSEKEITKYLMQLCKYMEGSLSYEDSKNLPFDEISLMSRIAVETEKEKEREIKNRAKK